VTESRSLLVDGGTEVELLDDVSGSEGEVLSDDVAEPVIGLTVLDGAVGVNPDGERVGESDGVGDLNADSVAKSGGDEGLGDKASVVGSGAIDLGGVLTGVSTTSMGAPTAVRVDDDLSASDTGISSGTTDIEFTGGVDDEDSVLQKVVGADLLDDLLDKGLSDFLIAYLGVVLGGNKNVEDSSGLKVVTLVLGLLVLNDDLRFAVGSEPLDFSGVSLGSHLHVDSAGELMGERVEGLLVVLVSSVSEHDSLISSTDVREVLGSDDSSSNVGVLGLDDGNDRHLGSIHTLFPGVEADIVDGLTGNSLEVNLVGSDRDFSEEAKSLGLGGSLHGDSACGVDLDAGIDDSIRDLIAHLIGMAFTDRFGGEVDVTLELGVAITLHFLHRLYHR
jgi:hypothetical protein